MAIRAEFPDKIRFYDQVLKRQRGRLFVATDESPRPGAAVELAVILGDGEPLHTVGEVVAGLPQQGAGLAQPPGVWIQLSDMQLESLRQLCRLESGEAEQVTARRRVRRRCDLPVEVDEPVSCRLRGRDISRDGICVAGALPVPIGETVRMSLDFGRGALSLFGRIVWSRADLTGIAFRFPSPELRRQVSLRLHRIAAADAQLAAESSVLVVDSDAAALRATERMLSSRGHGCIAAGSGAEALSLARQSSPRLIVVDVRLPDMSGLEVCSVLKRDAYASRVPVLLTAAAPGQELAALLRESGALGALPKPHATERLASLIERLGDEAQALGGSASAPAQFVPCEIESARLKTQGYLRGAEDGLGFVATYWGDAPGAQALLTVQRDDAEPLELAVELRDRVDWGLLDSAPARLAGMRVAFSAIEARRQLERWFSERQRKPL